MMMEEKKEAIEENQDAAAVVVVKEDEEEEDSKPKARRRLVVREEEDDMNECLAEIGFMMEGAMPTKLERFEWKASEKEEAPNQNQKQPKRTVVRVALNHIDIDQPGAVQSGHYLWPGARLLADYLVQNYAHYNNICNNTKDDETVESVLELGAGCALASLVALQVWQRTIQCIVVTDHDLGVLERARDNYESTLDAHLNASSSDLELNQVINDMASIPFVFEKLEWGTTTTTSSNDDDAFGRILDQLREHTNSKTDTFDVLLGSDLIYDATVVEPLLETVHKLLKPPSGRFLLSQSFAWDDQAEAAFTVACARLGLQQQTVLQQQQQQQQQDDDDGGRIHEFRLFAPEATTTTITDNNHNSGRPEEQASPEKDNTSADAGGDEKAAANNTDKKSSS